MEVTTFSYLTDGTWHQDQRPLAEHVCSVCGEPHSSLYAAGRDDDLRCERHRDRTREAKPTA